MGDRPTNVSKEWRAHVEFQQNKLDREAELLAEDVQMYNAWIRTCEEMDDMEQALEIAYEGVTYLDKKWSFGREKLLVSGVWKEPVVQMSDTGLDCRHETADILGVAVSNGFMVYMDPEEGAMRLGLSFATDPVLVSTPYIQGKFEPLAFANFNEVSLTYIRPDTVDLLGGSTQELLSKLQTYSAILDLYLKNPSSDFYQKKAAAQRRFFGSILRELDETLPDPKDIDAATLQYASVSRVYVPDGRVPGKLSKLEAEDDEVIELSGRILGFHILDLSRKDETFAITSQDKLIDPEAGICLSVEVAVSSFEIDELPSRIVYVPTGLAAELELKMV